MRETDFRRWIYAILILSALFRFGYLILGDVFPVMWDARRYVAAGIGLISIVDKSGLIPVKNANEDRIRFKYYNDRYIQGEQIEWLSYKPHTLTKARDDNFFSGPLYPFLLAVIFYLAPLADFTFARIFGIFIDLISNLLVILIAIRLVGRAASLIAGFIYAVYFPFILTSTILMLETSTSFWLLLSVYFLLRGVENNQWKFYLFAGITTGLLILNKPTAMFLSFPFLFGFYFYARKKLNLTLMVNRLLFFIVPVIIIFSSWLTIASIKYGQLTLREPTYKEANLRQSSSIIFEGYDLDKVEKDFWTYSIKEQILNDPVGYIGLLAKKFERLWGYPFNDFKKAFIIPKKGTDILHQLIVFLGLMGLILLFGRKFSHAGWLLFIIGYYTTIHVIFHSISRYSFNALPMVIIGTGYFIFEVIDYYQKGDTRLRRNFNLAGLLIFLAWIFDYHWINQVFKISLTYPIVSFSLIIKCLLAVIGIYIISRLLFIQQSKSKKLLMPVVMSVVLVIVSWSISLSRNEWAEFTCRLNDPTMKAGTRIFISDLQNVNKGELLTAVIDYNSGKGRKNSFTVTIGDSKKEFIGGKPPLLKLFYPKPAYHYYSQLEPIGIEEFRQYAIILLDDSLVLEDLIQDGFIDITVAINDRFEEENNFVNLYGNFDTNDTVDYIPGVRFTSIERYVHKNDPRIKYPIKFLSDSTISYYIKRNSFKLTDNTDLSPSPGIQTGRYNIFLIHFMPDGSFLVY